MELSELVRSALWVAVATSLPPLGVLWVVGWLSGLLQSALQVSDPVLSHLPRLLAAAAALWVAGPWMLSQWLDLAERAFTLRAAWP